MTIRLRLTTPEDIPFVYELEHAPENSAFLIPWTEERHQEALTNPDIRHLIVEKNRNRSARRLCHHRGADQFS